MAEKGQPPIYLDYNGTTPIDAEVCEAMTTMMRTHWGNPSSSHYYGVQAKRALETARRQVALLIGAQPGEITFMSNGTETINQAIKGLAELGAVEGRSHVITQATEHVAVLEVCRALEKRGCRVTYLPVDGEGLVSPEAVEKAITAQTFCVTIMHSNNETGALQPIREIVERVRKAQGQRQIYIHCDTSQSLGKLHVDVEDLGVDLLTVAGHKVYAPKGVGALYRRQTVPDLPPLLHGAAQEGGRRASTENVVHCVALGKACELARVGLPVTEGRLRQLRDRLYDQLRENLGPRADMMRINGPLEGRLPNTLNVSFYRVEANTLLSEIGDDVAASAGAACHSDEVHVSHVLEAMGAPQDWAMGTCRFSVGKGTTEAEVDRAARIIASAAARLMPASATSPPASFSAGERVDEVKLTHFTHGMGCACKLRPQVLEKVLEELRATGSSLPVDPNILAGLGRSNEDACVYRLRDDLAVVGTLDFFTPIVDEPEIFGGVAAANALSDVYAMGATPLFALNIVCFPSNRLPPQVLTRILQGGQKKCEEAKCAILGGHTVDDTEPKYGVCVFGTVHPEQVWRNNGVQKGDKLVLTKPLGTGVLSTAMKHGVLSDKSRAALLSTLLELNQAAAECARKHCAVHAATDVTGFGLLGHLLEMLTPPETPNGGDGKEEPALKKQRRAPPLGAKLSAAAIPLLPEARELAVDDQCVPGGSLNNLKGAEDAGVAFSTKVAPEMRILLADAQTSGGLLLAVPSAEAAALQQALRQAGTGASAIIGEIVERADASAPVISVEG